MADGPGGPVVIGETPHSFFKEVDEDARGERWRWLCSCSSRGHWSRQSESVSYYAWLDHLDRERVKLRQAGGS